MRCDEQSDGGWGSVERERWIDWWVGGWMPKRKGGVGGVLVPSYNKGLIKP
jgi:hypothetical protein